MGSGKTTMMTKICKDTPLKLLSICNLVSLTCNQHANFSSANPERKYKYYKNNFDQDDELFICLNSLTKLSDGFFNKRILYLDEFTVLLNSLCNNNQMRNTRGILQLLIDLIRNAEQVFITDADCNDAVFKFLDMIHEPYVCMQ